MIEPIMYVGLGFLAASLLALVIIPLVHDRAVRLTLRRINAAIPLSIEEIQAEQDQLRAEFAMSTRRLETNVEELRAQTASQRAELGKNTATINRLNAELAEKAAAIFALGVHDRALRNQLHAAEQLLTKNKLARITADLDQRSALADSQRIEIVALKTQVDTLKDQLALAYSTRVGIVARR